MASFLPAFGSLLIVQLLLPHVARASSHREQLCYSWRFNVEVNSLRGWTLVPDSCEKYVAAYMTGNGYIDDSALAAQEAYVYASSYNLSGDGSSKHAGVLDIHETRRSMRHRNTRGSLKYAWVFDIDETSLSNLPYYKVHNFGYVSPSHSSHATPLV